MCAVQVDLRVDGCRTRGSGPEIKSGDKRTSLQVHVRSSSSTRNHDHLLRLGTVDHLSLRYLSSLAPSAVRVYNRDIDSVYPQVRYNKHKLAEPAHYLCSSSPWQVCASRYSLRLIMVTATQCGSLITTAIRSGEQRLFSLLPTTSTLKCRGLELRVLGRKMCAESASESCKSLAHAK